MRGLVCHRLVLCHVHVRSVDTPLCFVCPRSASLIPAEISKLLINASIAHTGTMNTSLLQKAAL